ncbi:MAG: hypothetical protein EBU46_15720 [Nitrosomonadaceae bacterium]|nr:hypothetical protein [Nitrosomonadaceae bacterium]
MRIISQFPDYYPVIVRSKLFDEMWRKSDCYISSWNGGPRSRWFVYEPYPKIKAFVAAEVSFDDIHGISFVNGRHRTRWFLNKECDYLPVCITLDEKDKWHSNGLLVKFCSMIEFDLGNFTFAD